MLVVEGVGAVEADEGAGRGEGGEAGESDSQWPEPVGSLPDEMEGEE